MNAHVITLLKISQIIQTHPLEVADFHPLIPQKDLKNLKRWAFQPVPSETFVAGEAPEELID